MMLYALVITFCTHPPNNAHTRRDLVPSIPVPPHHIRGYARERERWGSSIAEAEANEYLQDPPPMDLCSCCFEGSTVGSLAGRHNSNGDPQP
jgi:hypothetical protein